MKKVILSLFVLLSLSTFTQEKYKIEIEPSTKISQNVIQGYNSQIEKEVSKIYSKEEMFGIMNKMMNGASASIQGKNGAKSSCRIRRINKSYKKFINTLEIF